MPTELRLPRLGQGMESGTIVRWLKEEGAAITRGEPLYELDTDKVTQEVEAEQDGVLLQILVASGEVEVGAPIAIVGGDGESASATPAPAAATEAAPGPTAEGQADVAPATTAPDASAPATDGDHPATPTQPSPVPAAAAASGPSRVKASPLARRIARERGVDLGAVVGTGPEGRVLADDVERAAAGGAPAPAAVPATAGPPSAAPGQADAVEVVALTSIRATIARRLTEAWTAPAFQLQVDADASRLLALRAKLVDHLREGEAKPTVGDVITRLVASALRLHPAVNATYTGTEIHRHLSAHVGLAVAAPAGLVVPVIRGADRLSVQEIAVARSDLVARARDGKLTLPELEGGTFTISNLGMFGIERFTAVLNPPQVAILAVGAAIERPVVVDGEIRVRPMLTLTLTCDHRALDGAEGAAFLQSLQALVESPGLAL
ncbi:MAG: dihydrolipoamide acetyltransferase family protein [Gaiella sp.]